MLIFWGFKSCNIGDINQRFGGNYCLHLQGRSEDGGSRYVKNVGSYHQHYTAYKSSTSISEPSPPWKLQSHRGNSWPAEWLLAYQDGLLQNLVERTIRDLGFDESVLLKFILKTENVNA